MRQVSGAKLAGVALLLGVGLLYLLTLDNGLRPDELAGGDLITHQYAQAQARFANAPGYPLYTLLGWAWFNAGKWVLGWALNPIEILSLYSTWWAMAALVLLYTLSLRVSKGNWLLSAWAVAFYAVTPFFWYYAVSSEQYSSAVFQTLLLVWLAFRWEEDRRDRWLLWMALVTGTCLANLVTIAFVVPGVLIFILWNYPGVLTRFRLILQAVGLALLPLVSYAFVYVQAAQNPAWLDLSGWPDTWAWFVEFLTAPQGRSEMTWSLLPVSDAYPRETLGVLTWPVWLLGLAGWSLLGRKKAALLYVTAAIYFVFCYIDRFGNWYQVIMPLYPLALLGFVPVVEMAVAWLRSRRAMVARPGVAAVSVALAALLVWRGASEYAHADQRDLPGDTALAPGWAILADDPAQGSCVAGVYEETFALQYLTMVWGVRGDLRVRSPDQAMEALAAGDQCTISRRGAAGLTGLGEWHPSAAGIQLVQLSSVPMRAAPAQVFLGALVPVSMAGVALSDDLELTGSGAHISPGGDLAVALFWTAKQAPARRYVVSARPTKAGQLIRKSEGFVQVDQPPVWGLYPTDQWTKGEVVRDDYRFALPPGLKPDGLQIIVYWRDRDAVRAVGAPVDVPLIY